MFCLPSYWMAIFLALAYGHLALLSFGSHTGAGREEKGLGEILGTHLSRSESGCSWFQKDFLPPIRGRSGISFKLDLSLHRWKDLVALMYAQSTSAGQDRTGTGQSTVLFQELRICWIKNIIPGFISAADGLSMHSCWYLLHLTALQWAENFLLSPYPHTLLPIPCLDDPMGLKLICGSNFF